MTKKSDIKNVFEKLTKEIQDVNKVLQDILPQTIVKETTTFGNSSHVVLPKDYLAKKVGIILLKEEDKE